MQQLGYSLSTAERVDFLLKDRKFRESVGHDYSSYRQLEAAVPQRAILAPQLYSIYSSDIQKTEKAVIAPYRCIQSQLAVHVQKYMSVEPLEFSYTGKRKHEKMETNFTYANNVIQENYIFNNNIEIFREIFMK